MRSLILLLAASTAAICQPVGAGLKVGLPFTDFLDKATSGSVSNFRNPKRYIVGATGELRLPFHLAVEVDALYRKVETAAVVTSGNTVNAAVEGNTWEFPLLLKYRFPGHIARPFIDGGYAWNRLSGLKQAVSFLNNSSATKSDVTLRGPVLGAGLDVKLLVLHIQPEVRLTRWGSKSYFGVIDYFNRNQTQAEFLVGISF